MLVSSFPDAKNKSRGIFNYRLVKQMIGLGEEVFVVFFRMWLPGRKVISSYAYDTIKVTQLCLPLLPIDSYYARRLNIFISHFFGWLLLKKKLNASDIIHSVAITSNGIHAGYWRRKLKIPHIAQAIGSDVNSGFNNIVKAHGFKKWMKNIDGIITNSLDLEKTIKSYFPDHPEIRTIYRGMQIDDFQKDPDSKNDKTTFLYLGGLAPNKSLQFGMNTKGGITLMEAWKKAEDLLFPLNATLYFGGPNSDISLFHKWKNSLTYSEKVNLIGKVDPEEVKKWLFKSDIVVVPSMQEGLPNFLMESYANGKPSIASTAGGIPEVMVDGETGYLFERGDAESLAALLIEAARNNNKNKIMGEKAFDRVKTFFNADNYSNNILIFYKKILNKCVESGNYKKDRE